MKYRKRPIVVEAYQMTVENGSLESEKKWPEWLASAHESCVLGFDCATGLFRIKTLEGHLTVSWNDFIIQGIKGELYPCRPDVFEATYEAVESL